MRVEEFLRKHKETGADLCDFFAERVFSLNAAFLNGRAVACQQGHYHGIGIRILRADQIEYYQTSDLTPRGICSMVKKILKQDDSSRIEDPAGFHEEPDAAASFWDKEIPVLDDSLKALSEISRGAETLKADLRSVHCRVQRFVQDVRIINSEGVDVSERRNYIQYQAEVLLSKGGRDGLASLKIGSRREHPLSDEEAWSLGMRASDAALEKLEAAPVSPCRMPVILGPGSGALLMHEACGHPLEADYVHKKRSVFSGRFGDQIAVPMVTVFDDPRPEATEGIFLEFDDEGMRTGRHVLIERGRIRHFLSDRRHVRFVPGASKGNGRRQSYRDWPIPRMTNLVLKPGDLNPQEIIGETKKGIYAKELSAGRVDPVGGKFVFRIAQGYEVTDGRIGRPVRDTLLRGRIDECLQGIDRVGSDFTFAPGFSFCDKEGQRVPVGMGQPTIRITSLDVGSW